MTRTIRARIHESAVKRVTRIYAATLADICCFPDYLTVDSPDYFA